MADTFYNAYGQEIELTGEQSACLKYTGGRTLMVKGFAGAGKSIVLMALAAKFKQGYFPYGYKPADPEEMNIYLVQMRNLVYVSMTRAKNQLIITYWGKQGSQFIGEMDPTMYELDGGPVEGTYVVPEPVTMLTTELPAFGARDKSDKNNSDNSQTVSLVEYLKSKKDITVNDKRDKGGALWISGTKDVLEPVMKERIILEMCRVYFFMRKRQIRCNQIIHIKWVGIQLESTRWI